MSWLLYALISAAAAALTAILAKVGVEGVPSNLATAIRTIVITGFCVGHRGRYRRTPRAAERVQAIDRLPPALRYHDGRLLARLLPRIATWLAPLRASARSTN
jgi:uncharacterized membrane protein